MIINTVTPPGNRSRLGVGGRNGVDVENSAEEVLDDSSLALLTSLLDALDLSLGVLVGFGLGLLVALAVLHRCQRSQRPVKQKSILPRPRTSCIPPPSWPCSRLSLAWLHRELP